MPIKVFHGPCQSGKVVHAANYIKSLENVKRIWTLCSTTDLSHYFGPEYDVQRLREYRNLSKEEKLNSTDAFFIEATPGLLKNPLIHIALNWLGDQHLVIVCNSEIAKMLEKEGIEIGEPLKRPINLYDQETLRILCDESSEDYFRQATALSCKKIKTPTKTEGIEIGEPLKRPMDSDGEETLRIPTRVSRVTLSEEGHKEIEKLVKTHFLSYDPMSFPAYVWRSGQCKPPPEVHIPKYVC